jgi:probable HAF family extracellular repeat protein
MRHATFYVGLGLAVLLSAVRTTEGQVQYNVTELAWEGFPLSMNAINNVGQIVGRCATDSEDMAALWDISSKTQSIIVPEVYSTAIDINNSGLVVGSYNGSRAFVWQSGTGMQLLGTLGGTYSGASGVNESGQVVGSSGDSNNDEHAFLWDSVSGMQILGSIWDQSSASDINDRGQVVGCTSAWGSPQAFLWQNDTGMRTLGTFAGAISTSACCINNNGQVAGLSIAEESGKTSVHAFVWQSDSGIQDLGALYEDGTSCPYGINDKGQVVGVSYGGGCCAFLWESSSGMHDLNDLIDPCSGWSLIDARAINDNGWIVGYGTNPSGISCPFLAIPIPEPSSLALLGTGAITLLTFVRRRARRPAR